MRAEFLFLPAELICHILSFLTPRDICHCALICKTVCDVIRNSAYIQYKLELYAQGLMETDALSSVDLSRKICSLKKLLASFKLWQSDFHVETVFEDTGDSGVYLDIGIEYVKCGFWWMRAERGDLFIRNCNTNVELPRIWPTHILRDSVTAVAVDPLQDLVITVSSQAPFFVNAGEDRLIFLVEFSLASSQLPYPDLACTSLECKHRFYESGSCYIPIVDQPAICGDRVVVLYYVYETHDSFIQVIDWRKGLAKSYFLPLEQGHGYDAKFRLFDKQTMVVISGGGLLTLYTLQELDGSPHRRITYLLPELDRFREVSYVIHATPSFHRDSTVALPDIMPGYVPSLESQIMVLGVLSRRRSIIFVIDMIIFSERVVPSETPVEIPWSDWGPQYTCCFPHHPTHRISVFGSRMAYALPVDYTPGPGQRVKEFPTNQNHFYVHIWDFNKRVITREKNAHDCSSPGPLIRKPGLVAQSSCFVEGLITHLPYTTAVCRTPFKMSGFNMLFLEQDRFTLTWSRFHHWPLNIQVVCPVQTEIDADIANQSVPGWLQ